MIYYEHFAGGCRPSTIIAVVKVVMTLEIEGCIINFSLMRDIGISFK